MPLTLTAPSQHTMDSIHADDVIELGLLLPKNRAVELMNLAKQRHETVAQLLRSLIDVALTNQR